MSSRVERFKQRVLGTAKEQYEKRVPPRLKSFGSILKGGESKIRANIKERSPRGKKRLKKQLMKTIPFRTPRVSRKKRKGRR